MAALSKWVPIGDAPNQLEINMKPIKLTTIDKIGGIYCHICHITFGNKKEYDSHYEKHGLGNAAIVYTCVVCHKEIAGYPSFRGHCYLQHVTKDKFKCEQCDKVFSKLSVLNSHIKTFHQYKCVTCNNEFQSKKELSLHQIVHKNDQGPPYECGTCGQKIDSTDDCEQHIEDHCNMTYSCPICDETISDIKNVASHLTKHFGNVLTEDLDNDEEEITEIKNDSSIDLLGGIFCSLCDQSYKARPEFDNHYILDHVDKPIVYACNICGKEYDKYNMFANHCYDHYARGRFQCEECFKCFPRLSLLVSHVAAYHADAGDPQLPFTCNQCSRGFKTQRRLRDHQRSVHNTTSHQCPDKTCKKISSSSPEPAHAGRSCRACGLRLASAAAAARHAPLHRRARFRCPVCDRAYAEKYLVMKHITHHFCSVLHICKICGKVYNARSRLNNHMKGHSEEKGHKCSYCGKGFTKPYLLQQHINIHTGLRPYSCTGCSKTFASHPNLVKHMKCMHNITKIDIKLVYNPNKTTKVPNPKPNTRIEKILNTIEDFNKENPNEESNDTLDNNNAINVEPAKIIEDVYETPSFENTDESSWKTENIDPCVLELLEENIGSIDSINTSAGDITDLENALWAQSPRIPTASPLSFLAESVAGPEPACVPREYGPEFVNAPGLPSGGHYISLDDHLLPHIDPLLTITDAARLPTRPAPAQTNPPWEPPVFTKIYPDYQYVDLEFDARYTVNTDIF